MVVVILWTVEVFVISGGDGGGVVFAFELAVSLTEIIFGSEKKTVNFKERFAGSPF